MTYAMNALRASTGALKGRQTSTGDRRGLLSWKLGFVQIPILRYILTLSEGLISKDRNTRAFNVYAFSTLGVGFAIYFIRMILGGIHYHRSVWVQ